MCVKLSLPKADTQEFGESSRKDKKIAKSIPFFILGKRGKVDWRKHEGLQFYSCWLSSSGNNPGFL